MYRRFSHLFGKNVHRQAAPAWWGHSSDGRSITFLSLVPGCIRRWWHVWAAKAGALLIYIIQSFLTMFDRMMDPGNEFAPVLRRRPCWQSLKFGADVHYCDREHYFESSVLWEAYKSTIYILNHSLTRKGEQFPSIYFARGFWGNREIVSGCFGAFKIVKCRPGPNCSILLTFASMQYGW